MISPGYSYLKAPDQQHFLLREQTVHLFRQLLVNRKRSWRFNQTPLFLEFLQGRFHLDCTPWGNPTYNVFGWQRPCYLLQEGVVRHVSGTAGHHGLVAVWSAQRQRCIAATAWSTADSNRVPSKPPFPGADCGGLLRGKGSASRRGHAGRELRRRTKCAGESRLNNGFLQHSDVSRDAKSARPTIRLVQLESASGKTLEPRSESR